MADLTIDELLAGWNDQSQGTWVPTTIYDDFGNPHESQRRLNSWEIPSDNAAMGVASPTGFSGNASDPYGWLGGGTDPVVPSSGTDWLQQMINDGWSQGDAQNYLNQADQITQMTGDGWTQTGAQDYLNQADWITQMMDNGWSQADAQAYLNGTGGTSGSSTGGNASAGGSAKSWLDKALGLFKTADGKGYDLSKLSLGGLAGGALIGALTDNAPVTEAKTRSDTTTLPSWYTDAAKGALTSAANLPKYQSFFPTAGSAAAPFSADEKTAADLYRAGPTAYGGALTQSADPNTLGAAKLAASSAGAWQPTLTGATDAATRGGSSVLDMDLAKYMNPFWQNALQPQEKKIRQDQALSQNAINDQLAKVGAFGGSRTAVAQALNQQEGNRRIDDMFSTGAKTAFDSATGLATGDRSAQQQLATMLSGLATTGSNLAGSDISRLSSTGSDLYGIDLNNTLRPYQEFTRQQTALPGYISGLQASGATERGIADTDITRRWQDYLNTIQSPATNQAALTSALTGVKAPGTIDTVETSSKSPESPWKSLLGAGSTLWGLANPKGVTGT